MLQDIMRSPRYAVSLEHFDRADVQMTSAIHNTRLHQLKQLIQYVLRHEGF